jgi:hypothetical protein
MPTPPTPNPRASAFATRIGLAAMLLAFAEIIPLSKAAAPDVLPAAHTEKVLATPHFFQCDPRGRFAANGDMYCCPTAVSDSLMYLASHGFPNLLPNGITDTTRAQITLIDILAVYCMKTDPVGGTSMVGALGGIECYVEASGYECDRLEYRGWRPLPKNMACYHTGLSPSPDWIKKAAADPHGAAWVNIGWYVHTGKPDEWTRVGGHWVAVVGFGVDGNGHADPNVLLVDNPAVPAMQFAHTGNSAELAADVMNVVPIGHARLVGEGWGLPHDAAGMYSVSGPGVSLSPKFDAAFVDGAIVLVIRDPQQQYLATIR